MRSNNLLLLGCIVVSLAWNMVYLVASFIFLWGVHIFIFSLTDTYSCLKQIFKADEVSWEWWSLLLPCVIYGMVQDVVVDCQNVRADFGSI